MINVLPFAPRVLRADVRTPSTALLSDAQLASLGVISTPKAALLLGRQPATLQRWAVTGGPLVPVRIYGRLGWRIADVERLLSAGS